MVGDDIYLKYLETYFRRLTLADIEQCKHSVLPLLPKGRTLQPPADVEPIKGGILILIYPVKDLLTILFIIRTEDQGVHSGQTAFPGGKFEPEDITTLKTALREAKEEIGFEITETQVAAKLTPLYIPPSNFLVDPYVAFVSARPTFYPNRNEVADIVEVPLWYLLQGSAITTGKFKVKQGFVTAPCYQWNEVKIWGATAIILSEFLCLVKNSIPGFNNIH